MFTFIKTPILRGDIIDIKLYLQCLIEKLSQILRYAVEREKRIWSKYAGGLGDMVVEFKMEAVNILGLFFFFKKYAGVRFFLPS